MAIFVLIRPRAGDFIYSEEEYEQILADVRYIKEFCTFVAGIVIGCLTNAGDIDESKIQGIISIAGSLEITFHRAFDVSKELGDAMKLIYFNYPRITRILT